MSRKAFITVLSVAAIFLLGSLNLFAQSPNTITYQGKLTNAAGAPTTVATNVVFRIYAVSSGGTFLWTETHNGVTPDANGVFTRELGATAAFPATLFDGSKRYLGITVGTDAEMTPRQVLNNAPYAFAVENVPGIARGKNNTSVDMTGSVVNLTQATITVPGPGYVIASAQAIGRISGTANAYIYAGVETSASGSPTLGEHMYIGYGGSTTFSGFWAPLSTERVFSVASAGSYTYYYNAVGTDVYALVYSIRLRLMYVPAAYGTVSPAPTISEDEDITRSSTITTVGYDAAGNPVER